MKNALTIDVEDWFQTNDFNFPVADWNRFEYRIEASMERLLALLAEADVKATFFMLGCIADACPGLVHRIAAAGHELGSHGYWHQLVEGMNPAEFRKDLLRSKRAIENITGQPIVFYRAPSWSITPATYWMLQILETEGFRCDSSIQPFRTPLSGVNHAPMYPWHPVIDGQTLNLLEFPPTVLTAGPLRIPFAGGFYLRFMPLSIIEWCFRQVNRHQPGLLYVHPWEMDEAQPRLDVPLYIKFIHYYNLQTTKPKVKKLLQSFEFVPLGELIDGEQYPAIEVRNSRQQTAGSKQQVGKDG